MAYNGIGRVESMNAKLRPMTRIAIGLTSQDGVIARVMLSLSGYRPALPDRIYPTAPSGEPARTCDSRSSGCRCCNSSTSGVGGEIDRTLATFLG